MLLSMRDWWRVAGGEWLGWKRDFGATNVYMYICAALHETILHHYNSCNISRLHTSSVYCLSEKYIFTTYLFFLPCLQGSVSECHSSSSSKDIHRTISITSLVRLSSYSHNKYVLYDKKSLFPAVQYGVKVIITNARLLWIKNKTLTDWYLKEELAEYLLTFLFKFSLIGIRRLCVQKNSWLLQHFLALF